MTKKELGRRGFLKKLGLASAVVSGTSLVSCSSDNKSTQKWSVEGTGGEPTGEMTYRTNPNTGDKVSLLGYGCMRWPMKKNEEGKDIVASSARQVLHRNQDVESSYSRLQAISRDVSQFFKEPASGLYRLLPPSLHWWW